MDARKTTPGDGDERNTENVVRLQRDWLGPPEELVPMGPRAGTAEAPVELDAASLPPTAASFWDEDSGSLQAPMQAPADAWHGQWEPVPAQPTNGAGPSSQRASARGFRSIARLPRLPRLPRRPHLLRPRLSRVLGSRLAPRGRHRPSAVAGILAACALAVLAVIAATEGSGHRARVKAVPLSTAAPIVTAAGVNRARLNAHTPVVIAVRTEPKTHRAGPPRRHRHRTHVSTRRPQPRSVSQPPPSASQPVHTTTPTHSPAPATSAPSTSSASSAPPSARPASSSQQPAFGSSGVLGPGRSPDS